MDGSESRPNLESMHACPLDLSVATTPRLEEGDGEFPLSSGDVQAPSTFTKPAVNVIAYHGQNGKSAKAVSTFQGKVLYMVRSLIEKGENGRTPPSNHQPAGPRRALIAACSLEQATVGPSQSEEDDGTWRT